MDFLHHEHASLHEFEILRLQLADLYVQYQISGHYLLLLFLAESRLDRNFPILITLGKVMEQLFECLFLSLEDPKHDLINF